MSPVGLREVVICAVLALLLVAPARADDNPQPLESFEAWIADFMTCFRARDDQCLHDVFAEHWYPIPDLESPNDDQDAFFAFLHERMAFAVSEEPFEFHRSTLDGKFYARGFLIPAGEGKQFVLIICAWLVDEKPYLFRAEISDDLPDPTLAIGLIDLSN